MIPRPPSKKLSMSNKQSRPFVSVIIPVFNDAKRLQICLSALARQTYPSNRYEVIVVDNGSDEDIAFIVAQFSQASIAYEHRPGSSYAARNRGVALAKGEVIAFTDADCIPATDWLENGVARLLEVSNCGLVAGKVELFCADPEQPTAVELYELLMAFPQQEYLEKSNFGATANVMTYKSVIDHVGEFDATLESSGDAEWGKRIFLAGYRQVYADDTCVAHPARSSWSQLYKKLVRVVQGQHDWQQKKIASKYQRTKIFLRGIVTDLRRPLDSIDIVFKSEFPMNNWQKIRVILIMFLRSYVKVWTKIRLQFAD